MKYHIFCDMDGVLTDLAKEVEKSGVDRNSAELLAKGLMPNGKGFFIEIANRGGLSFWTDMEWMPNGKKLWEVIKDYLPTVLSAYAPEEKYVIDGKVIWVRKNLGKNTSFILCERKDKQNYSKENHVLIDDRENNIIEWEKKGGIGILYDDSKFETVIEKIKRYLS